MTAWQARLVLLLALATGPAHANDAPRGDHLPTIGPAPDFTLTSQDGARVSLSDFRGKVVAIAFIYTYCTTVCPMLTANMAQVRDMLGSDFGAKIDFVSITLDPERDTPEVLKEYAEAFGADPKGWPFLTGDLATVRDVALKYGVFARKTANGDIDHTTVASLVDPSGTLRVQYLGARFDLEEFRDDLLSLLDEAR